MKNCLSFIFCLLFAFSALAQTSGEANRQDLKNWLNANHATLTAQVSQYDYSRFNAVTGRWHTSINPNQPAKLQAAGATWSITQSSKLAANRSDAVDVTMTFTCTEGSAPQVSVSAVLDFDLWAEENYVLLPAAAYNGNRFTSRRLRYSPKLLDPRDIGPDQPTIITDVPRLNIDKGPSRIQARTGDMSSPSIGFFSPGLKQGFWMLMPQATKLGDSGVDIEENRGRNKATITLTAPVVRERYKYRITDMQYPSDDVPANFSASGGDETVKEITLTFRLYFFNSNNIQGLYDRFAVIRKDIKGGEHAAVLPFSAAFDVQEKKFNEQNYVADPGYYAVGMRENFLQDWQIGWTGGMISTYPLLAEGGEQSVKNVKSNFDLVFPHGVAPSGFFWDSGESQDGIMRWYGGDIRKPHTKNWHLVRKSGDGLFYVTKQLSLMKDRKMAIKPVWESYNKKVADAFVKLWNENKQLGNFIDNPTGKIQVGGSTSGAIVPAALVLASQYYNEPKYLKTAEAIGDYFYKNFTQKGFTTGGPGDAMQNPDSESSYALVESYVSLYEATGNKKWLQYAEESAKQFATWVVAYDYDFPQESLFGRTGMHSLGAVFANTQNKHGSPGICTHSGVALLKIYRATGDAFYAELLKDISRNMPQYMGHPKKPIEKVKDGWVCERVSTTDWLEGIGEITYQSTWAETALMLSYIELPGVYVQAGEGKWFAFDNVKVSEKKKTRSKLTLEFKNTTALAAKVKVVSEKQAEAGKPWQELALQDDIQIITLAPGETKTVTFKRK